MAKIIEIQMTPTWVDHGENGACYLIERVDVDKYLHGKTFRKKIANMTYEVRFEKEHIIIREGISVLCEFSLKTSRV